ncbi:MAG TPA: aminotransferase class V-fold PLP-dependent enzyme [Acidimicrobiia bacterium]
MATWNLDPGVTHLNHGSFGATPVEVLAEQQRWRDLMESNPVSFMLETYQPALEDSREAIAGFVGADSGGVVLVPNATYGVNAVLRSMEDRLAPGAEIIITNHGYNACSNAVEVSARKVGAEVVTVDIPVPVRDEESIVSAILNRVSEKTALVVLDHVTSPTGLIFPVKDVVESLEPAIPVLVDGAHAPGMIPLALSSLGASFYTANCHKWMCAPKGTGFLYVAPQHREATYAAVVSHGYNDAWPGEQSHFQSQFDWTGTHDPTSWFSIGAAVSVMNSHHPDGWDGIRSSNHQLTLLGRDMLTRAVGTEVLAPESMIGSIASISISPLDGTSSDIFDPLMIELRHKWAIEVPVFTWPDRNHRLIRISAQQYNNSHDYERLAEALVAEL